MFSFIFQAGVLVLIDKYIMCVAEMFNTGSRVFFLLSVSHDVWPTEVHSPIYSNVKDARAMKQVVSKEQLSLAVRLAIIWMLLCLKKVGLFSERHFLCYSNITHIALLF